MIKFIKNYYSLILLFVIIFISRLPFLSAGYGVEEDSWGIALEAFNSNISGSYEPSRLPGHPVQELVFSAIWGVGPIVFNGLCALFSAIGVLFFALILKHFHFKHSIIAAYAFAFLPVYYITSTYTIDYSWTEAFVLISLYALLKNKLIVCGLFLGLAVGCRITSGAMLIPFIIIVWEQKNNFKNLGAFLKMFLPMSIVALLAFTPIIQKYGISFFMYYDQFPYPPLTKVLYKLIPGVFGLIGTMALIGSILVILFNKKKQQVSTSFSNGLDKKIIYAAIVIIILYIISYFRLPQKSGYMIPVIPFVIILFGYYLNGRNFKDLCICFIISSFLFSINLTDRLRGSEYSKYAFIFKLSGQEIFVDPFTGPVFSDYSKRKQKMEYTHQVIRKTANINSKTVIIAGWWRNEILVTLIPLPKNKYVEYVSYINEAEIKNHLAKGYSIYYLPEQQIYNDQRYNMNITTSISQPFEL
ncbi:MAG: hypothetical protein ABI315_02255 [Bacteroidia bacterium]